MKMGSLSCIVSLVLNTQWNHLSWDSSPLYPFTHRCPHMWFIHTRSDELIDRFWVVFQRLQIGDVYIHSLNTTKWSFSIKHNNKRTFFPTLRFYYSPLTSFPQSFTIAMWTMWEESVTTYLIEITRPTLPWERSWMRYLGFWSLLNQMILLTGKQDI